MEKYVCNKVVIGKKMREARSKFGLSQIAVSFAIGRSESTIAKVESGNRLPSLDMLFDYMNEFDVDANFLLGIETGSIDSKLAGMDREARHYLTEIFLKMIDNYPNKQEK